MRLVLWIIAASACGSGATRNAVQQPQPIANVEAPAPPQGERDLAITGIEPQAGDTDGGTYVRLRGSGFMTPGARNAKVYFGNRQGTVVRFANDGELIVEAPGGKVGEIVDVLVIFEPGGELRLATAFKYVDKGNAAPSVNQLP